MASGGPVGHRVGRPLIFKYQSRGRLDDFELRIRCVSLASTRRVGHFAIEKLDLAPHRGLDKLTLHEESSFRLFKLVGDL